MDNGKIVSITSNKIYIHPKDLVYIQPYLQPDEYAGMSDNYKSMDSGTRYKKKMIKINARTRD